MTDPASLPFDDLRIRTSRLLLRAFAAGDAPIVESLAGDRNVALKTGNIPHPYPPGAASAWIEHGHRLMAQGLLRPLAVVLEEAGELIGCVSFRKNVAADTEAEIAYWLGKAYWGRGFMPEAAAAALAAARAPMTLASVWAGVLPANPQSIRVLEKLGMTYEETYTDSRTARGGDVTLLRYGMALGD